MIPKYSYYQEVCGKECQSPHCINKNSVFQVNNETEKVVRILKHGGVIVLNHKPSYFRENEDYGILKLTNVHESWDLPKELFL